MGCRPRIQVSEYIKNPEGDTYKLWVPLSLLYVVDNSDPSIFWRLHLVEGPEKNQTDNFNRYITLSDILCNNSSYHIHSILMLNHFIICKSIFF